MNAIQGTQLSRRQWNRILDEVVTIIKYKKSKIYHSICIKVFSDGTVSYITVSIDDVLITNNNETEFHELPRAFEEHFEMKVQEGSVLKYLNFRNCQSPLGFSIDHNYCITELVN